MTQAKYILNAFSLNFFNFSFGSTVNVSVTPVTTATAAVIAANAQSAVGHQSTADVFSDVLGVDVACNRTSIALVSGDQVLVGQYKGPRLQEGATQLPEGATIAFLLVTVN